MASFIPIHRKKFERLRRLEADLRRLLERGVSEEKLLELAAEIRDARIRVLRAKHSERTPQEPAAFLGINDQIAALQELSAAKVLAEYRRLDKW